MCPQDWAASTSRSPDPAANDGDSIATATITARRGSRSFTAVLSCMLVRRVGVPRRVSAQADALFPSTHVPDTEPTQCHLHAQPAGHTVSCSRRNGTERVAAALPVWVY